MQQGVHAAIDVAAIAPLHVSTVQDVQTVAPLPLHVPLGQIVMTLPLTGQAYPAVQIDTQDAAPRPLQVPMAQGMHVAFKAAPIALQEPAGQTVGFRESNGQVEPAGQIIGVPVEQ